jgi:hypothetical protein
MMSMRRHHLLKWAVVICSLLLPLTAVAGMGMSQPGASGYNMSICQCYSFHHLDCHQCGNSLSPCSCPGLAVVVTNHDWPGLVGIAPYKSLAMRPEARIHISCIYHPPQNTSLFSL